MPLNSKNVTAKTREMDALEEQRLQRFIEEARESPASLSFILDNLGMDSVMDMTAESLSTVRVAYDSVKESTDPVGRDWKDSLLYVAPIYIGEMITRSTAGRWTPETRTSLMHQGPYRVTGFGDMKWESYYPKMTRLTFENDSSTLESLYADAMHVWELRNAIVSGVTEYFATNQGAHQIADIMKFLESTKVAPLQKFGVGRFKQFQKRTLAVMRSCRDFRRIPKVKDTFELRT